eukprot:9243000-Alexandrium_andersonii.AAC.1
MGGVVGQRDKNEGALRILMYRSSPLSEAQSQWHPFEQEFWATVEGRDREAFGRIPPITYADHGAITRLE